MSFIDELSTGVLRDWMNTALGAELGRGMQRVVFVYDLNPRFVIKVESGSRCFQNIIEWNVWYRVRDTAHARWFAPCRVISPTGSFLVMERTTPPRDRDLPKRMPAFLTDFKRQNYGMLNGRFVCHDYGVNLFVENGMTSRMRKADWWSLVDEPDPEASSNG